MKFVMCEATLDWLNIEHLGSDAVLFYLTHTEFVSLPE